MSTTVLGGVAEGDVAGQEPLAVLSEPLPYASGTSVSRPSRGRWLSVSSVSIFLFICTFWVMLGVTGASGRELVPLYCLSGLALFAGAILGLVGMIFRGNPKDRIALIVGIIGLSLNGLVLLGNIVLIVIVTFVTVSRLRQRPANGAGPAQVQAQPQVFNTYQPSRSYSPSPLYRPPQIPPTFQPPRSTHAIRR